MCVWTFRPNPLPNDSLYSTFSFEKNKSVKVVAIELINEYSNHDRLVIQNFWNKLPNFSIQIKSFPFEYCIYFAAWMFVHIRKSLQTLRILFNFLGVFTLCSKDLSSCYLCSIGSAQVWNVVWSWILRDSELVWREATYWI